MRWMDVARSLDGIQEVPGGASNPLIMQMVRAGGDTWSEDDSKVMWCGYAAAWCLKTAGIAPPPQPGRADSYLHVGTRLDAPRPGCIAVIKSSMTNSGYHVTFYDGPDPESPSQRFMGLGGNQGDAFSRKSFALASIAKERDGRVIGWRWPIVEKTPDELAAEGSRIASAGKGLETTGKAVAGAGVATGAAVEAASQSGLTEQVGTWTTTITTFQGFGSAIKSVGSLLADFWPLLALGAGLALFEVGRHVKVWRAEDHNIGKTG